MRRLARLAALLGLWLGLATAAGLAQDSAEEERDRGFLAGLIEDNLSTVSRQVVVNGFQGALSSQATVAELTIADGEGIWLRATGLTLDWNRSALLRGRIEVEELSAESLEVLRPPVPDPDLPAPEASPFALPELPVSVEVGDFRIDALTLGEPLLGEEMVLAVTGAASLAGGEGTVRLAAERSDAAGTFVVEGSYSNESRILDLSLDLTEPEGGLVARTLGLPGAPALELVVEGEGPIDTYAADISLATDGDQKLGGRFEIMREAAAAEGAPATTSVALDLSGNLAPLLPETYRPFVGTAAELSLEAARTAEGETLVPELRLATDALSLEGEAVIGADNWPVRLQLEGALGAAENAPVTVPGGTDVGSATLSLAYDAAEGDSFTLVAEASGVDRGDLAVDELELTAIGSVAPPEGDVAGRVSIEVDFTADGLAIADPALADALGSRIAGHALIVRDGGPVALSELSLTGPGLELSGEGTIDSDEGALVTALDLALAADDLSRFAGLAGTELSGAATLDVGLRTRPLDGAFDVTLDGQTQGLGVGNPALDALLAGTGTLDLAATRDETGTRLERLLIATPALEADATATLTSGASEAAFDLSVPDVSVAIPGLAGAAELTGTARIGTDGSGQLVVAGTVPDGRIDVTADLAATEAGGAVTFDAIAAIGELAPYSTLAGRDLSGGIEAAVEGTAARDASTFDLGFAVTGSDLALGMPAVDPILAGTLQASGRAARTGPQAFRVEDLDLASPLVTAQGSASYDAGTVETAGLAVDVADLAPFSTLAGRELSGAAQADVAGRLATDLSAFDLTLDARAEDLGLGIPGLESALAGPVTLSAAASRTGPLDFAVSGVDFASPLGTVTGDVTVDGGVATTPGLSVRLADLAPLSGLARRTLGGSLSADLSGSAALDASGFDLTVDAEATDLVTGLPQVDPLLQGTVTLSGQAERTGPLAYAVTDLDLASPVVDASGSATLADGVVATPGLDLSVTDLSAFAGLAGRPLEGALALTAEGEAALDAATFDLALQARSTDLAVGIAAVDALLAGPGRLDGRIARTGPLDFAAEDVSASTPALGLTLDGALQDGLGTGTFDLRIADTASVAPGLSGGAALRGTVARTDGGDLDLDVTGSGPGGLELAADAVLTPLDAQNPTLWDIDGDVAFALDSLGAYSGLAGRPLGGSLEATLAGQLRTDLTAANVTFDATAANLDVGVPAVAQLLAGTGTAAGRLVAGPEGIRVDGLSVAFPNLAADADVSRSANGETNASFDLRLADLGLFVPDFPGAATVTGTATGQPGGGYLIDVSATGPGGVTAAASGAYNADGTLALDASGSAPLGLANAFIAPRRIDGLARFELSVDGPPALSSVSGQVTTSDARLALPELGEALTGIDATIGLGGGQATVDVSGSVPSGGTIRLSGPVALSAPFDANLTVDLNALVVRDPALYEAQAGGQITITGPLAGGATIAGLVRIARAEIRVPSGSLGNLGALPEVAHVGAPQDVQTTLARAGLTIAGIPMEEAENGGGGGGPGYALNLTIEAPGQIFVRGRGLDAELGGSLTIVGTIAAPIPAGQFELIRGRLDILQQRFDLSEGRISLLGDFSPYLRLVAVTEAPDGTEVRIILDGEVQDLQVTFESSPQLPQDEVLARLLFGRDIESISPLQAVQLAAAISTLAGGGPGLLDQFRTGLGLDDFDVTTTEGGGTAVRLGRYLSENVYTDITVGTEGTEASINLDLTDDLTVRGAVSAEGGTSLGIFFERDY